MLCRFEPYYHTISNISFLFTSRDRMKGTQDFPSYPIPGTQPFTPLKRLGIPQTPMKDEENLFGFSLFVVLFPTNYYYQVLIFHHGLTVYEILRLNFFVPKKFPLRMTSRKEFRHITTNPCRYCHLQQKNLWHKSTYNEKFIERIKQY